ncbi:MAG: hypothetical protein L0211_10240 [Planctomycetaceae bacterium]|nr:hypothetical protein [Planctomycetaceae bacterium]
MRPTSPQLALLVALLLGTAGGCRWNEWFRRNQAEPPPILFNALPSRDEAVAAINANSARIQSLQTQGATVSIPGAPSISAEIALEKPKNFRFRASTFLGSELDLGSNSEQFWFWAARAPEPHVFFARHDLFAGSRARQMLPIEPTWLIEALGVVEIDPATILEGPIKAGDDRVELRTMMQASAGEFTRLVQIHGRHGWILEQHLYDGRGQLIASARNLQHEYYHIDGVSLPKRIEVEVPQGKLRFQLDISKWAINQQPPEGQALYELPRTQLGNYRFVDIADPNFVPPGGTIPVDAPPPRSVSGGGLRSADLRDRYRGFR